MSERITVKEASEILGCSELTVRAGIQEGTLPIGRITNIHGKRKSYLIYRNLVDKVIGKE